VHESASLDEEEVKKSLTMEFTILTLLATLSHDSLPPKVEGWIFTGDYLCFISLKGISLENSGIWSISTIVGFEASFTFFTFFSLFVGSSSFRFSNSNLTNKPKKAHINAERCS